MKSGLLLQFLRRIPGAVFVWVSISFLTFAIIQITTGDPVRLMMDTQATEEQIERRREELGLNDGFFEQYLRYMRNTLRGDWGASFRSGAPVLGEIRERLPATIALGGLALALAIAVGIPAGILASLSRHKWLGILLNLGMIAGHSVPTFVLALFAVLFFGVYLGWISVLGAGRGSELLLPALCVAVLPAATIARFTQSSVLEVLGKEYVRTARAKGANEKRVVVRHVLRNALIPVVTITGLLATELMTGTTFVEMIFGRAGLGRFAVEAVLHRDFPQVQGIVLFTASAYFLFNWMVDLAYLAIDPRLRNDG